MQPLGDLTNRHAAVLARQNPFPQILRIRLASLPQHASPRLLKPETQESHHTGDSEEPIPLSVSVL
jgi:hypothetical protein